MANPAPTAIGKLTMPPTMAAANPLIDNRKSSDGFDETTSDTKAMPATPATTDPPTHDTIDSCRAETPRSDETSRSVATARMASPVDVYLKKTYTAAASASTRPITPSRSHDTFTPATLKAAVRGKMARWLLTMRSLAPNIC